MDTKQNNIGFKSGTVVRSKYHNEIGIVEREASAACCFEHMPDNPMYVVRFDLNKPPMARPALGFI